MVALVTTKSSRRSRETTRIKTSLPGTWGGDGKGMRPTIDKMPKNNHDDRKEKETTCRALRRRPGSKTGARLPMHRWLGTISWLQRGGEGRGGRGEGEGGGRDKGGKSFGRGVVTGTATGRKAVEEASLRVGSVNVGTMRSREGEVSDMLGRRKVDICCLQETRWKGESARTIGGYKFYWKGCKVGVAGVGIMVASKWVDSVIEVRRVSERMMVVRLRVGKSIWNVVSVYAPQAGRSMEEKELFFSELGGVLAGASADERVGLGRVRNLQGNGRAESAERELAKTL